MRDKRKSILPDSDSMMYVPVQTRQPSYAKRHRLKWSRRLIRKHQLNRIKCVDEEVQARINAKVAAKSSFDAGVAAAAENLRTYGASSASAGAFSSGASAFVADNTVSKNGKVKAEKAKKQKKPLNKKALKCVAIIAAALILASALGFGTMAALNNFLFIPDADVALENALEAKLDIGTKFDISDLLERGKIEFVADDMSDAGLYSDTVTQTILYNKDGASVNATFDNQEFNFVFNKKGAAFNAQKFESDKYYGFSFDDIAGQLDGSFLNPDNDSINALSDDEYKELLDTLGDFEYVLENEGKCEKDAKTVRKALEEAFEESTLSESETSYGGLVVSGEARYARSVIYNFNSGDILDYAEKLAAKFDSPSTELSGAVENLLTIGETRAALESAVGGSIEGCDDIAEVFADIAELLETKDDDWSARLVLAYVGRAFTAIQLRVVDEEQDVLAVIDFGKNPARDKKLSIRVDVNEESGVFSSFFADYGVEKEDGKGIATLSFGTEVHDDPYSNDYDKTTAIYRMIFDSSAGKATLTGSEETEHLFGGDEPIIDETQLFEITFNLEDSLGSLSLELDGISSQFGEEEFLGSYKLTLSKYYGWIKLPEYENVLLMDADDYDELDADLDEYFAEFKDEYIGTGFDLTDLLPEIDLPGELPTVDPSDKPSNKPSNKPSEDSPTIESGTYIYNDGTGYTDTYFFNNGSYSYKGFSGGTQLFEERGTYEVYSGYVAFSPNDGEEYELNIDSYEGNELILDGVSYFRQ